MSRATSLKKEKGDNSFSLDLVIKLGGAAITDKSSVETLREKELQQGAALIKLCHDSGQKVAVVHGAGSFGHPHAKKYKLNEGLNKERGYHGFCKTRNAVSKLNTLVVECLIDHGLPAVSCPAFPAWQTCEKVVSFWPEEVIRSVLTDGLMPVFHGDGVLDSKLGFSVLSGDTIIEMLCKSFTVKRVVFLTDVSGVYDKPPSEDGAKLLQVVSLIGQVCSDVKLSTSAHDVTGGMLNKIQSAHQIVMTSSGQTRVFITKIGSKDAERLCQDKDMHTKELEATEIVNLP